MASGGGSYNQSEIDHAASRLHRPLSPVRPDRRQERGAEYGRKANNLAAKPGFFDVMPNPYADLVVSNISLPSQAFGGQPLTVTWTVKNQGIGTTDIGDWNDFVYLASTADGNHPLTSPQTFFDHFGFLAVGDSYQHTQQILVPNGLSGNVYVVVTTGGGNANANISSPTSGPFEFIYESNDTDGFARAARFATQHAGFVRHLRAGADQRRGGNAHRRHLDRRQSGARRSGRRLG